MEDKQKASSFAIISVVFGIIGLATSLCYGGIFGIVGLVFGIFVFIHNMSGKKLAWIGVITSGLSILITILVVLTCVSFLKNGGYEQLNKMMYQFQQQMEQQQNTK